MVQENETRAPTEAAVPVANCAVCHHPADAHGDKGCEVDSFLTGMCFCERTPADVRAQAAA